MVTKQVKLEYINECDNVRHSGSWCFFLHSATCSTASLAPSRGLSGSTFTSAVWVNTCSSDTLAQAVKAPWLRGEEGRKADDSFLVFFLRVNLLPEWQSAPAAGVCLGLLWLSGWTWTPAGLQACCMLELHPDQHGTGQPLIIQKSSCSANPGVNIVVLILPIQTFTSIFYQPLFNIYQFIIHINFANIQNTTQWLDQVCRFPYQIVEI